MARDPEKQREHVRQHYRNNKDYYKAKAKKSDQIFVDEIRQIKNSTPCADCGMIDFWWRKDFDHLPGTEKLGDVSAFVAKGKWRAARLEIQKCEVVCSNCHRDRTYKRNLTPVAQRM